MNQSYYNWLFDPSVSKVLTALIAVGLVIIIARVIKTALRRYIKSDNTRYNLRKFITFLSYFVIVLLITLIYSDQLGGLTVALGVAGAGVAFALQEVIASFAGWFAITFAKFYSTGDRVQLGGIKGDVIDISFLRTTLMEVGEWVSGDLYNGRVVRVANSFVFKEPVFNYSGDFPFLWDEITVPVKFGSDHQLAKKLFEDIVQETTGEYSEEAKVSWDKMLNKYLIENASVSPNVSITVNDNWIEFTLRYVVDFKRRRYIKNLLFTQILDGVAATDSKVQFASATFHIVEAPPLDVRISNPLE